MPELSIDIVNISPVPSMDLSAKLDPKWRAAIKRATLLTPLGASWQEAEISAAEFVFDMSLLQSGVDEHQADKFTISLGHLLFWIKAANSLTDLVYPSAELPLCAHLTHRVNFVCSQDQECIPAIARVLCERGIMLDDRLLGANIAMLLRRAMDNSECITNAITKGHYGLLSQVAKLGEESKFRVLRLLVIDENFSALVKACLEPSAPSEFSTMVHKKPQALTEWASVAHSSRYATQLLQMLAKHEFKTSTSQIGWASSSDSQKISNSSVFLAAKQFFAFVDDRNDVDYFLQILRCVGSVAGYGLSNAHEDALIRDFAGALLHSVHVYAKVYWVPGSSGGANAAGLIDEQTAIQNPYLRAFLDSSIDTTVEAGTHGTKQYAMQRSISSPLLIRNAFKGLDRAELYCKYGSHLNCADILINFLMASRVEPNEALFSPRDYRASSPPWTTKRTLLHCLPMAYASGYLARHQSRLMSETIDKGISTPTHSSSGDMITSSFGGKMDAAVDCDNSTQLLDGLGSEPSDIYADVPRRRRSKNSDGTKAKRHDTFHDTFTIQSEIAARSDTSNTSMDVSAQATINSISQKDRLNVVQHGSAIPEDRNLFKRIRTRMGSL